MQLPWQCLVWQTQKTCFAHLHLRVIVCSNRHLNRMKTVDVVPPTNICNKMQLPWQNLVWLTEKICLAHLHLKDILCTVIWIAWKLWRSFHPQCFCKNVELAMGTPCPKKPQNTPHTSILHGQKLLVMHTNFHLNCTKIVEVVPPTRFYNRPTDRRLTAWLHVDPYIPHSTFVWWGIS